MSIRPLSSKFASPTELLRKGFSNLQPADSPSPSNMPSRSTSRDSLHTSFSLSSDTYSESSTQTSLPLLTPRRKSRRRRRSGGSTPDGVRGKDDDDYGDSGVPPELSVGAGSGFASWFVGGKLGWYLWSTRRGAVVRTAVVVFLYGAAATASLVFNRLVLQTGVYKFGYPITLTFIELLGALLFLRMAAGITRTFSRTLFELGLGCFVAPGPMPRRDSEGRQSGMITVFSIEWKTARKFWPVAIAFSVHLILSNFSFAYSMIEIYNASRTLTLPLTIGLSTIFLKTSESIPTLSASITISLSLVMSSIRPHIRFTPEGFVAGFFSALFSALFPILLAKTLAALKSSPHVIDALTFTYPGDTNHPQPHVWTTLYNITLLSTLFLFPWTLISGEVSGIIRNCYFLDVPFFYFMLLLSSLFFFLALVFSLLLITTTSSVTYAFAGYPVAVSLALMLAKFRVPAWCTVGGAMVWGCVGWYIAGKKTEGAGWGLEGWVEEEEESEEELLDDVSEDVVRV